MSALLVNGQNIALDKEGFLLDLNDWSPAAAEALAAREDLQARALNELPSRVKRLDYPAFVELTLSYAKVNSWL